MSEITDKSKYVFVLNKMRQQCITFNLFMETQTTIIVAQQSIRFFGQTGMINMLGNYVNIHCIISRVGRRSKREERVKVKGATYSKHVKVCLCAMFSLAC